MTTKLAGGKITGLLALTLEAQYAASIGDPVMVTGPYEVGLANGTKPLLGHVSVANKKRLGADYPVANTPGDVTVEALGFYVNKCTSGQAITAGAAVRVTAGGLLVPVGTGLGAGTNETQTLTRTSTGGTFKITFDGVQSAVIDASAAVTAAVIEAALEAMSNIDPADVGVTGSAGGPFTVTFTGRYAAEDVPLMTIDNSLATGGTVVAAAGTPGVGPDRLAYDGIALTSAATNAAIDVLFR